MHHKTVVSAAQMTLRGISTSRALPSLPLLTPDLVQGGSVDDVFSATYTYMKKREAK